MAKFTCPHCKNIIELDKNTYNELLNDVSNEEVNKRVLEQTKALEATYKAQLALEQQKAKTAQDKEIAELKLKNQALEENYKTNLELEKTKTVALFEKQIAELKQNNATLAEQLKNSGSQTELEVAKAMNKADKVINDKELQINQLLNDIELAKTEIEKVKQ